MGHESKHGRMMNMRVIKANLNRYFVRIQMVKSPFVMNEMKTITLRKAWTYRCFWRVIGEVEGTCQYRF